jgi:hypothetical protein
MLQTLPPDEDSPGGSDRVAKEAGFSLHAGVSAEAHQRDKLERLCRYICRPAVSEKRLAITSNGRRSGRLSIDLRPRIGLQEVENWCVEGELAAK